MQWIYSKVSVYQNSLKMLQCEIWIPMYQCTLAHDIKLKIYFFSIPLDGGTLLNWLRAALHLLDGGEKEKHLMGNWYNKIWNLKFCDRNVLWIKTKGFLFYSWFHFRFRSFIGWKVCVKERSEGKVKWAAYSHQSTYKGANNAFVPYLFLRIGLYLESILWIEQIDFGPYTYYSIK